MAFSLFRSGLVLRTSIAVVFAATGFGAVWLLRNQVEPVAAQPLGQTIAAEQTAGPLPSPPSTGGGAQLEIESILPVDSWEVRVDGEPITGTIADPHRWAGTCTSGAALLAVDARLPSETAAESGANSLRLRLSSEQMSMEWIEWVRPGEIALVALDQLRAHAPAAP